MFRKVLVANRGEIAIRAFRAAYELGCQTVAVFPYEDRNSEHRLKANEAYQIGEKGHPVRAYLSVSEIIRAAQRAGADAIYPGYGFLSENPKLAMACRQAGVTFIGPPPAVLALAGNKSRAVAAASEAGVPVLASCPPSADIDQLMAAADEIGFPMFVKAVAGGGGRGMRRVTEPSGLRMALEVASREAESAFGDPTVFLEQAVIDPRHIEVQILADPLGDVIHLYERDCSVQRRHQKVVEVAPAPNLDPDLRQRICADAVAFARQIGYVNAGTVEFLVDRGGHHVFIEMNPRIQVEHTVTEEITDIDLVTAQMRIAAGETLADLGLYQDMIVPHGAALQCRITTEDPANEFRPDIGTVTAYRSASGAGVRLDGGTMHAGAQISAHFDSLLVKVTCRGRDFPTAVRRARRALAEFRIRGVATNIPFLLALLDEPDFEAGNVTTSFIEQRPHLLTARQSADRGTRLLTYLGEVTVNRPHGDPPDLVDPVSKLPPIDPDSRPPTGSRHRLLTLGPEEFARWLRAQGGVGVTETTFRDAHQSLLATRVRSRDLVAVGPHVARMTPQLLSLECWGGATYDVALRFLAEDPWERLASLREAIPNICLQMLLRGRNTVGYTPYPTEVTAAFVEEAVETGLDIFRIFDAARTLVAALRSRFDLPVHLHTHDTPGGQLATLLAAIDAGADAVDAAAASMAGTTSQPSLSALVAATDHTERNTGLDLQAVCDLEPYWELVRKVYAPFESGLASPTGRVYHHEIPGGQLSNLRQQAVALGLADRFEQIEEAYAAADRMLGRLVKVTPSSKVVGDLALHLVGAGVEPKDFETDPTRFDIPDSVIGFLHGELGVPPGGWPEPLRSKALKGRSGPRGMAELPAQDRQGLKEDRARTLNRLLFPGPTAEFEAHRETYGDTSVLCSEEFFYGLRPGFEYAVDLDPGVRLLIQLQAIGDVDERGMRTVLCTLNGQMRPLQVRDRSVASKIPVAEKADRANSDHVAAPFAGVVTLQVAEGETVSAGQTVATIEAMKMEAGITAAKGGTVARLAIKSVQQVEGGDLILELS
jgi:pyruvate carboxylase